MSISIICTLFITNYKHSEGLLRWEVILRPQQGEGGRGPPLVVEELRQLNLSPEVIGAWLQPDEESGAAVAACMLRAVQAEGAQEVVDLAGEIELRLATLRH